MSTTNRLGLAGALAGLLALISAAAVLAGPGAPAPREPAVIATQQPAHAEGDHADAATTARGQAAHPEPKRSGSKRSRRLIERTRAVAPRWKDVDAAVADGFESIGDSITGYEHFVQWDWTADDSVLDPKRPESLVYRVRGDRRRLVSVMYILPPGTPMRDVPNIGDDRAQWHRHTNLCWDGRRVAGLFTNGQCLPGGTRQDTSPMLHVWLTGQRCGPFAGLGVHGSGCDSH